MYDFVGNFIVGSVMWVYMYDFVGNFVVGDFGDEEANRFDSDVVL